MTKANRYILSDESVNRHGYILRTSGMDLKAFQENPVLLFNHDYSKVIGKWIDIKVEGNKITAVPEFDEEDQEALSIKKKVEKGLIKCISVGCLINPKKITENEGEPPIVEESELLEASFTPVGSNKNAVKLYKGKSGEEFNDDEIQELFLSYKSNTPQMKNLKALLIAQLVVLKINTDLKEDTPDAEFISGVTNLLTAKDTEIQTLSARLKEFETARVKQLITLAINDGKILKADEAKWTARAEKDFEMTSDALSAIPKKVDFNANLGKENTKDNNPGEDADKDDRSKWTYNDWEKKDSKGLLSMKRTDPDKFKELQLKAYPDLAN